MVINDDVMLLKGNCLDKLEELIRNKVKVDAVICDPPYGTTKNKWDSVIDLGALWDKIKKIRKDNSPIVIFGAEPFSSYLRISNIKEYKYDWVWEKNRPSGFLNAKKQPLRNVEFIHVFYKKQAKYNPIMTEGKPNNSIGKAVYDDKCKNNNNYGDFKRVYKKTSEKYPRQILRYDRPHPPIHPTQKPVELMEYLVKTYTDKGDIVLDFTMGSGTTGVACKNTGRKFIGIELDEKYFNVAKKRIEGETGNE